MAYCRSLALTVFPRGLPDQATIALVRESVWRVSRATDADSAPRPIAWDPAAEPGRRVDEAFRRGGLAAAFAEAAAVAGQPAATDPAAGHPRIAVLREFGPD